MKREKMTPMMHSEANGRVIHREGPEFSLTPAKGERVKLVLSTGQVISFGEVDEEIKLWVADYPNNWAGICGRFQRTGALDPTAGLTIKTHRSGPDQKGALL